MRVRLSSALLLLSCSLLAQSPTTGDLKKSFPPDQRSQIKRDLNLPRANLNWAEANKSQTPFSSDLGRCFFIRSYNFERQGTGVPVLKNVTTCTPAKSDQFRQTDKPKAKLIPAN